MTYNLSIDLEFATINDLSLVQVSTLAAFITLPTWSETIALDGAVWYRYTEERMSEDFPVLFGCPKRCYKNISELKSMGYVDLIKIGRNKYVRFTEKCCSWGKKKVQKRTDSPKTDEKKSENGPKKSPKTDSIPINYNININSNINDKENAFFPPATIEAITPEGEKERKVAQKERKTAEPLCLFENSRYNDIELFKASFDGPEFADVDLDYYFHSVADWSSSKGAKKRDWIATARNFMRGDMEKGKLHRKPQTGIEGMMDPDEIAYLKMGWDGFGK